MGASHLGGAGVGGEREGFWVDPPIGPGMTGSGKVLISVQETSWKFYRMRSSVAHSGRSSFTDIDLDRLMLIVLKVILEVVSRADRFCTQGDLDNEIQLMKFS